LQSETFQFGRGQLVGERPPGQATGVGDARDHGLVAAGPDVVSWRDEADRLVVVNFGASPAYLHPRPELPAEGELVASTDPARVPGAVALERFVLLPREAVLLRLSSR
jgi:hypothetical protein